MNANITLIVRLAMQLVTFAIGVLTAFGVTLDPAQVEAFKALVSDAGAQAVGVVLIVSALSNGAQGLWREIRHQMENR